MSVSIKTTEIEPVCIEMSDGLPTVRVDSSSCDLAGLFDALKEIVPEQDSCISLDLARVHSIQGAALEKLTGFANTVGERNHKVHLKEPGEDISRTLDRLLIKDAFCLMDIACGTQCQSPCGCKCEGCKIDYFTLSSELCNGRQARKRVDRLAEKMGYSMEVRGDVQVAVGEAFTNAVQYGGSSSAGRITISCLATSKKLSITVTDNGSGFEPGSVQECNIEQFCEHGRGIQCIEALMDDVDFDFEYGTTIRMIKHI